MSILVALETGTGELGNSKEIDVSGIDALTETLRCLHQDRWAI